MAHLRKRHVSSWIQKLASLWPIVGVYGLRQSGKSTLLSDLWNGIQSEISLDDDEARELAQQSAKSFLGRFQEPLLIDEVQKAPKLFDALKLTVDQNKRPGRFFITGSMEFSSRLGVRESLTGRIGLLKLLPLTLSEAHEKDFQIKRASQFHQLQLRFKASDVASYLNTGGMPAPMFMRASEQREIYFQSWIETSLFRDAARAYGKNYDPDFAYRVLQDLSRLHKDGIMPTTSHMKFDARKIRRYLQAFCDIFLITKIAIHEAGVGKDAYLFSDAGIAQHLIGQRALSEDSTRSLLRIFLINELSALHRYQGKHLSLLYYKSQKSDPVDFIWNDIPIYISTSSKNNAWTLRPLEGAMKKLKSKKGILLTPTDQVDLQKSGISTLPWAYWS